MKKFLASILCLTALTGLQAEVLTPAQALGRLGAGSMRVAAVNPATAPVPVATIEAADMLPAIYIFNSVDGYSVVSADDVAMPLLGYSDSGTFDPADMPDNMKGWLDIYASRIAAARAAGVAPAAAAEGITIVRQEKSAIEPICRTLWNQDAPYNNMCPKSGSTPTYTGCVATAAAQVLKTYQYPDSCSGGKFTYLAKALNRNITLNFSSIGLDWAKMLNTYSGVASTSAQRDAVAKLMYAVGVSAKMNYATSASGAYGLDLAAGLVRNFAYDPTLVYENRDWYDLFSWEDMVYSILAGGHAAYYDGVTKDHSAGHAFVVDGYQSKGYFHLNWGWGGQSNGYFLLDALDPLSQGIGGSDGAFNDMQGMLYNLKPIEEGSEVAPTFFCDGTFAPSSTSATKGGKVSFTSSGFWNVSCDTIASARYGVKFVSPDGTFYYATVSTPYQNLPPYGGSREFSVTIPSKLGDGIYCVSPILRANGNKIYDFKTNYNAYGSLIASVAGTKVTFFYPTYTEVAVTDFEVVKPFVTGDTAQVKVNIANEKSTNYYGNIYGSLVNRVDGSETQVTLLHKFEPTVTAVPAKSNIDATVRCIVPVGLPAGEYDFCVLNGKDVPISGVYTVEITVPDSPIIDCSNLKVISTEKSELSFSFSATNRGLDFKGKLGVALFSGDETSPVIVLESEELELGSSTVTVSGAFPEGEAGVEYKAVTDGDYVANSATVTFTLTDKNAGITEVNSDDTRADYFDILGRRVDTPANGAVTIKRQAGKVTKVLK